MLDGSCGRSQRRPVAVRVVARRGNKLRSRVAVVVCLALLVVPTATSGSVMEAVDESASGLLRPVGTPEWDLGDGATVPDVEVPAMGGPAMRTFTTETKGVWRSELSAAPVNYETAEGWFAIDADLHAMAAGGFGAGANSFGFEISSDAALGLASVDLAPGRSVGWALEGAASVAPVLVDSRAVVFAGVLDGVEVHLESLTDGVKESVVLESLTQAPETLRFPLSLVSVSASMASDGSVAFTEPETGVVLGGIPRGFMVDSSGPEAVPAYSDGVTYGLVVEEGTTVLEVQLDREWLADPARVWPVIVDPTLGVGADYTGSFNDTFFTKGFDADQKSSSTLRIGDTAGGDDNERQALFRFSTDSHFDEDTTDVLDASVKLTVDPSYLCREDVRLFDVTSAWYSSPDTYPRWPGPASSEVTTGFTQDCTDTYGGTWTVTGSSVVDLVADWLAMPSGNNGIKLASANGANLEYFYSTNNSNIAVWPLLTIEWTYLPQFLQVSGDGGATYTAANEYDTTGDCYPDTTQYGTECRLDLYWDPNLIASTDQKTVVLVHSGAYAAGYDSSGLGRRRSPELAMTADAFAANGYVVAVIDYRQDLYGKFVGENLLRIWAYWMHCGQAVSDYRWSPSSSYSSADPCNSTYIPDVAPDVFDALVRAAADDSVADVEDAVGWLRAGHTFGSTTIDSGQVFLVGASAGAYTAVNALYALSGTQIDGVVSLAGTVFIESSLDEINDANRSSWPSPLAPVQFQTWDYNLVGSFPTSLQFTVGDYDLNRQMLAYLRDTVGFTAEMRGRCGGGHTPDPRNAEQFDDSIGDAVAFLDGLSGSTPSSPDESFWFGAANASFSETDAQDLIEDRPAGFYELHVGDFNGDGTDDIFWFGDAADCDTFWYGQGNAPQAGDIDGGGTFARPNVNDIIDRDASNDQTDGGDHRSITVPGTGTTVGEQSSPTAVLVGDFDDDGADDLFWYRNGTANNEAIWYGLDDTYDGTSGVNDTDVASTGAFDRRTCISAGCAGQLQVNGAFDEAVVADFNGDGHADVYFDETGTGSDAVWYGGARIGITNGDTFTKTTISQDPTGDRDLLVGDFNGDGYDDLYLTSDDTQTGDVVFYGASGTALDTNSGPGYSVENGLDFTTSVVGDLNGDGADDIYFHDDDITGQVDQIWYGTSTKGSFTTHTVSSPPNGGYTIAAGNFDGDTDNGHPLADLVFHHTAASGNDYLQHGQTGTSGLAQTTLTDAPLDPARIPIVGNFGEPAGAANTYVDILWHYARSRRADPTGSNPWRFTP